MQQTKSVFAEVQPDYLSTLSEGKTQSKHIQKSSNSIHDICLWPSLGIYSLGNNFTVCLRFWLILGLFKTSVTIWLPCLISFYRCPCIPRSQQFQQQCNVIQWIKRKGRKNIVIKTSVPLIHSKRHLHPAAASMRLFQLRYQTNKHMWRQSFVCIIYFSLTLLNKYTLWSLVPPLSDWHTDAQPKQWYTEHRLGQHWHLLL